MTNTFNTRNKPNQASDLLLVVAITLVAMLAAFSGSSPLIGILFGLPLALILPGYALVAAGMPSGAVGALERLLFSLGASIALSVIGGFALNLTPWGLRPGSWALLLGGLTLLGCAVAFMRRRTIPPMSVWVRIDLRWWDFVLFGVAALIAGMAFVVATNSAASPPAAGFTQLSMLPAGDSVQISIHNFESQPMDYRLELAVAGTVVRRWNAIALPNDGQWQASEALNLRDGADVEARLYRANDPSHVYRLVTLR
jgi:hypothetical protein